MADEDFGTGESGASATYPAQCSTLRKGTYVMIKERPCKIIDMSTSKTGKHGHAKVHLIATDIFTGKKLEELCPSTHNMNVPIVDRKDYQLLNITDDGFLSIMDDNGVTKEDVKLPESERDADQILRKEIMDKFENEEEFLVSIISACSEEAVVATKNVVTAK